MAAGSELSASVVFGRFRVLLHRRELLADDHPVKLGGRAFDVLLALLESRGAVVGKDALMARVWPDRVVEENNLQTHISALRAALGPDRDLIRTVSGRGYQFAGEIRTLADGDHAAQPKPEPTTPRTAVPGNLPEPVSELIGRDDQLPEILGLVGAHRLITLTGAGGIGKTRLALAAARALWPRFTDGVWLIQLSALADPRLVPGAVATALGLEISGEALVESVARALTGRELLLVLDTCEHVIDAAASMADAALGAGPELRIIATSREPLRTDGEWVYPVPALAVPPPGIVSDDELGQYGASRLFVERVRAADPRFAPDRPTCASIAAICRRLDGIPLAIELAAARTPAFGIEEVAAQLRDRFQLLTGGRRTAFPRHQTLRATLDWSYELLSELERVVLRRLAVFAGSTSLDVLKTIVAGPDIPTTTLVEGITSLVAKSLVHVEISGPVACYRLFNTTRAYALEKLVESRERATISRRHAEYYRTLFESADAKWETDRPELLSEYQEQIDNLRAALNWAFSPQGDTSLGVRLAAAAVPLWFKFSMLSECRDWVEKSLDALAGADAPPETEMVLQYALGYSVMVVRGTNDRARTALTRASELAEQLSDLDYRLHSFAALASICHRLQDFQGAVALGRRAEEAVKTSSNPVLQSIADWILGASLQLLGNYAEALTYAERTRSCTADPTVRRAHIARLGRDSFISSGATMALIQWTRGLPDKAAATARTVLADAEAGDHVLSVCLALTWCGCVIPLRLGDLQTAEDAIARLKDRASRHGLSAYHANGMCFEGQLAAARGDAVAAVRLLRTGLANLQQTQSETLYTAFLSGLAEMLSILGRAEARIAAEEAVWRAERADAQWWLPEALRIKGEALLRLAQPGPTQAEADFRRSRDLAARSGALSWELRAAMSIARLCRDSGRAAEAKALLWPIYDRFTEGFDTADLRTARALLDTLDSAHSAGFARGTRASPIAGSPGSSAHGRGFGGSGRDLRRGDC